MFDKLKPKKKDTTTSTLSAPFEEYDEPESSSKNHDLNSRIFSFLTSKKVLTTSSSTSTLKPRLITLSYSYIPAKTTTNTASDDVFYKLKQHCTTSYDKICSTKKLELYELIQKCNRLKIENRGKPIEACRDVLSIFCYVFYDTFTCYGEDYDPYMPGKKKYTHLTSLAPSTATSRKIPIIINPSTPKPSPVIITTKSSLTSTTTKTTAKSTSTVKLITTTKTTAKPSIGGDLISPFDGPVENVGNFV